MSLRPVVDEVFVETLRTLPIDLQEAVLDYLDRVADDPGGMTLRRLYLPGEGIVTQPLVVALDDRTYSVVIAFRYGEDEESLHIRRLLVREL